jgi:hypothetical protein
MTPKEKADELHVGYWHLTNDSRIAKQCALIAVDEILSNPMFFSDYGTVYFWQSVKKEIEKL